MQLTVALRERMTEMMPMEGAIIPIELDFDDIPDSCMYTNMLLLSVPSSSDHEYNYYNYTKSIIIIILNTLHVHIRLAN